ncbi:hypothetical protein PHJA_002918000 [Phtheirospermum japonicum]|uniref:Uncharacterized protein n=1 Tax=Phtheirospermum japonicum TaxID=374723 RepID=A0A830D904_9LAMI|nr:hypothetical protein PHJA_002918000 [Phtheirospermum japonicum]
MSAEYNTKKGRGITKGENAAEFKTEASAILKQHARWKKIPMDRKKMLCLAMKNKDDEKIFEQPPEGITVENWQVLIDYFESDEFKRYPETGQEPTRTSTWMKTRFSNKKKDWIDDASREAYEDIMKLQNEGGVDTEGPVSKDEAFLKVLGPEKPSRLRGCGDRLKPPSKRGESINQKLAKENEELRKQADADRECYGKILALLFILKRIA